jgi:CubicO group peptidase (beta-lactamase class C family)
MFTGLLFSNFDSIMLNLLRSLFLILLIANINNSHAQSTDPLSPPIVELPVAALSKVGMSQDTINKVVELINTNPPNDFRGLVVIRNHQLVVEEYFNTYWRETVHDIRSAGKSVTALLLGLFPKIKIHCTTE